MVDLFDPNSPWHWAALLLLICVLMFVVGMLLLMPL
jgi:hypothetical protein